MLDFMLYNNVFELIINFLIFVNFIPLFLKSNKEELLEFKQMTSLEKFKFLYLFSLFLLIIYLITKNFGMSFISIVIFLMIIYTFIKTIKGIHSNKIDLTVDDKIEFIISSIFFIMFFSSNATNVYKDNFVISNPIIKEWLLSIYLVIKLILFVFSLLVNIFIFISLPKVNNFLEKTHNKLENNIKKIKSRDYIIPMYKEQLYNKYKNKFLLILDIILFIITSPLSILLVLVVKTLLLIYLFLTKSIFKLTNLILIYFKNSNKIIIKFIKITMIFSLIVTNFIIINESYFSNQLNEMFTLLSTVILIPIILDNIKERKEKSR